MGLTVAVEFQSNFADFGNASHTSQGPETDGIRKANAHVADTMRLHFLPAVRWKVSSIWPLSANSGQNSILIRTPDNC